MCEQDTSRFFDLGKVYCHTHTLLLTGTSIYQIFSFKIVGRRGFLMVVATITGTKLGPQIRFKLICHSKSNSPIIATSVNPSKWQDLWMFNDNIGVTRKNVIVITHDSCGDLCQSVAIKKRSCSKSIHALSPTWVMDLCMVDLLILCS